MTDGLGPAAESSEPDDTGYATMQAVKRGVKLEVPQFAETSSDGARIGDPESFAQLRE